MKYFCRFGPRGDTNFFFWVLRLKGFGNPVQEGYMLTLWVHLLGDLQSVRVGQVSVGRGDSQNQTALLGDELHQHVPDLVLNVYGLVSDGNLSHSRKVDQGQVQHWVTWTVVTEMSNTNKMFVHQSSWSKQLEITVLGKHSLFLVLLERPFTCQTKDKYSPVFLCMCQLNFPPFHKNINRHLHNQPQFNMLMDVCGGRTSFHLLL